MDKYQNFQIEDFVSDENFVAWILQSNPTRDEQWKTWLAQNPHLQEKVTRARAIITSISITPPPQHLSQADIDSLLSNFEKQTRKRSKTMTFSLWLSGAAAAVLVTLGMWYGYQRVREPASEISFIKNTNLQEIVNDGVVARLIQLSDGSLVLLRPNSTLKFPTSFGKGNREVSLKGDAFFEIHKDPNHPFLVKAGQVVTKVLGTSFDVITTDKTQTTVVVKTGEVQVYNSQEKETRERKDTVVLIPNQKALFNVNTFKFAKINITKPLMLSPVSADRIFSFNDAPLTDIIEKLEQAYEVNIEYDQPKFKDHTVTASLSNLSLEEKIRAICKAIDAKYEFQANKINIY